VQQGSRIEVRGNAQSSTRVSALMRNIDDSEWLRAPGLEGVDFVTAGTERNAQFKVFAEQVSMVSADGETVEGAPQ
jgi:type IV pilus assembly protein PilN